MAAATVRLHAKTRRLASPAEAALYAGVSIRTLRRWAAEGRFAAYRFGPRAVRYDLDDLDALAEPITTATAVDLAAAGGGRR